MLLTKPYVGVLVYNEVYPNGKTIKGGNMKFEVDTDTILEKIKVQMLKNIAENAMAQKLPADEVEATVTLNRRRIEKEAQTLAVFFVGLYVEIPKEEPVVEAAISE